MKTELIKEQSQHLISLGVPKEKATGNYSEIDAFNYPIFTLTNLLEILPKEIDAPYCKRLCIMNYMGDYEVGYGFVGPNEGFFFEKSCQETELIDALYELICWCIENNYIEA